jgi:hypothetical protein
MGRERSKRCGAGAKRAARENDHPGEGPRHSPPIGRAVGDGRWAMDDGRWTMDDGTFGKFLYGKNLRKIVAEHANVPPHCPRPLPIRRWEFWQIPLQKKPPQNRSGTCQCSPALPAPVANPTMGILANSSTGKSNAATARCWPHPANGRHQTRSPPSDTTPSQVRPLATAPRRNSEVDSAITRQPG